MNAIIFSAIMGVVMMFTGIFTNKKPVITLTAIVALVILLVANILNSYGIFSIQVDTKDLLHFNKMGMFFNTLMIAGTLLFVLLSGPELEKLGNKTADFYALIFFVLCGTAILTSFNGMLMLFLGIEILSIPLYILTGSDKKNLKSNEASLKYFLMGSFTTGIMLMGIVLLYGATGSFGMAGVSNPATPPSAGAQTASFLQVAGMLLLFAAMSFKIMW